METKYVAYDAVCRCFGWFAAALGDQADGEHFSESDCDDVECEARCVGHASRGEPICLPSKRLGRHIELQSAISIAYKHDKTAVSS